ncbi:site-specific integrase [Vibrio alginolyticus]|uniref:site-specific integrase n=1 Tax=Vibrio harveyi group TaxID=717610 RepID=UPI002160F2E4|nr:MULTISPECIES: site-specific integrase [Vibrio harveyi group]ELB2965280.1 site-specific integrase [Vibrio parahaemolyticus]MCS0252295.1 site-specific integrase [Vibrio alginolyticus]
MEHFYHLVATSRTIEIGDIELGDSPDSLDFTVSKPMRFDGVNLLFSSSGEPEFYANAFIMSRRIVEGVKDTEPTSYALLRFFRYLGKNNLNWNDENEELERYPIYLFRNYLDKQIAKGNMRRSVGASTLSVIRRFYVFCYRHGYVEKLPFEVRGHNKYGQMLTDITIKSPKQETELTPMNDLDIKHIRDNWHRAGISGEFRLLVATVINSGLRAIEVADIKPRHFKVPKGFKGKTYTDIKIGSSYGCYTKYSKDRTISMPVWLMEQVTQYCESERYKERKRLYFFNTGDEDAPVFITKEGNRFKEEGQRSNSIDTLWGRLRNAIKENSNPHFDHDFHDTRATYTTNKLDLLLNIPDLSTTQALKLLKDELGHKDLSVTMRYLTHWEGNPTKNQVPELMMALLDQEHII